MRRRGTIWHESHLFRDFQKKSKGTMANTPRFTNSKGRADLAILAAMRQKDTTATLEFEKADFREVNLSHLDISDCYFNCCRFHPVNFQGPTIEHVTLLNSAFTH